MTEPFPSVSRRTAGHRLVLLVSAALVTGCATHRVATIEDHYLGGAPTDGATLPATPSGSGPSAGGRVAYRPTEVTFEPIVPVRTEPETIAVLELAHPGEDGTWVAPHYVVVLVRSEGWVGQLPPTISEPLWSRPPRTPAAARRADAERVGLTGDATPEDSR